MKLKSIASTIASYLPTLIVLGILVSGWMAIHKLTNGTATQSLEENSDVPQFVAAENILRLPEGKIRSGTFKSLPAEPQSIEHVHTIPGRLGYDETRHVEIKAPLDGILKQILVTPGQQVKRGDVLAILRSPEIGQARADVLKRKKDLEIAQQMLDRDRAVADNLKTMLLSLEQGTAAGTIETSTLGQSLGNYRQEILTAHARLQLANELLSKVESLSQSGAIAGRTVRERQTEREVAETTYRTASDQSLFSANQAKLNAEAKVADADRQLKLARQGVESLLGYQEDQEQVDLNSEEATSHLKICAPFDGTIESRSFANNERVSKGDSLLVLANTGSLYVSGSIRENDWPAIGLQPDSKVKIEVPALENRIFEGCIRYVGREVQSETNSMPLVALIDNSEGLLRPGMFVRVTIPIDQPQAHLSVKPESVVQHENQSFVFVDLGEGHFKKVDVSTGRASNEWIEIKKGLSRGDLVVTEGAFLLKSELLLQGESE